MRNDTTDDAREPVRHGETKIGGWARPSAGATVSIPPRPDGLRPFGSATLHARLALLRPQPLRLRPAPRSDG